MADEATNRAAFRIQAHYCTRMGAPIYAGICTTLADAMTRNSAVGARVLDWPGEPTRDALPLRLMGGLHALVRAGADEELAAIFAGGDAGAIDAVLQRHSAALLPWLDGPPQTNEAGRSATLMTGLLEVARRHGPRLELIEIGSSAGINLLIDRFGFDLGGTLVGPQTSTVMLRPEWRGAAPEPTPVEIVDVRGCDQAPLDATDPEVAARLLAYAWPEAPQRAARLAAAIEMQRAEPVALVGKDAADWVDEQLARPQVPGATRVLMHSVVWQYLPDTTADRIIAAMDAAGTRATDEHPLAWVMVEPDRSNARHVLRVKSWPGHGEWQVIASAHAHGAWIESGPPPAEDGIALPEGAIPKIG